MNVSDIKNVACVGGGVIGSSWAIQYALKGLHVTLYDINDQQLAKSHDQMLRSLDALVAHNAITAARKDEIIACVRPTTSMEEAVPGRPSSFRRAARSASRSSAPFWRRWSSMPPRTPCTPAAPPAC